MLQLFCSCGQEAFVFDETANLANFVICKKCGKRNFGVWCEKDQAGFYFPEDSENIDLANSVAICEWGKEKLPLVDAMRRELVAYLKEEIPEDVLQKNGGAGTRLSEANYKTLFLLIRVIGVVGLILWLYLEFKP